MAAVLLATSCSKDDDSVQTQNFASQSQTGIPFSIRVSTGNTLSKIGYAPDADPDKAGYYNISFSKQDENKLAMVISYSGGEELTTLDLANAASGEFTGTIETVPAADAKLVASITTNGKALPTSSDVSLEDLLSKCAHIFKSSTFHYGDEEITLTDRAVYLAISMSPCCEHTIHINNKAYTIKDGRLWVAMSSSGALVCDELGLKKSHINAFAGEIHAVARQYFSVSPTKKVYFSNGNLQYNVNDKCWRFATNQYDYIGSANSNISSSYSGWIDLFGWGTSGWNSGANAYQPYSTIAGDSNYYPGGAHNNNLTGTYANADWGIYNAISNGGNQPGLWRTLRKTEWDTLIDFRTTASGMRYAKATVNGVLGLIILPDNWDTATYAIDSANIQTATFSANVVSAAQWTTLENAGCVFLPFAGSRDGSTVNYVNNGGYYWSATYYYREHSYCTTITINSVHTYNYRHRNYGHSVRLVQKVP